MRKSFTLIEVLVATFIFSMAVLVVFSAFYSSTSYQAKTRVVQETTQAARNALEQIARKIRAADPDAVKVYTNTGEVCELGRDCDYIQINNEKYFRDSSNSQLVYCRIDTDCSSGKYNYLTPSSVAVTQFSLRHTSDDGIRITLTVRQKKQNVKVAEKGIIVLQTTIYKRRYTKL